MWKLFTISFNFVFIFSIYFSNQIFNTLFPGDVTFYDSDKGVKRMLYNGFIFTQHFTKKDKVHWRCLLFRQTKCKARARTSVTKPSFVAFSEKNHNHDTDIYSVNQRKFKIVKNCRKVFLKESDIRVQEYQY